MEDSLDRTRHTIVATERAWAPYTVALVCACTGIAAAYAAMTWPFSLPDALLVACTCVLLGIVFRHIARREISVGLLPIAASAVFPVAVAAYAGTGSLFALAGAVASFAIGAFMFLWFQRMALATRALVDAADEGTAIVLGCAVRQGRPTTTLELRLNAALDLWRRHPAIHIIVTGGVSDPAEPSEASVMADELIAAGVPASQVHLEDAAVNTQENLANAKAIMDERGLPSPIWLVTSDYHMWRAARIAREAGIETVACASKTPASTRLLQWSREVLVICFGS